MVNFFNNVWATHFSKVKKICLWLKFEKLKADLKHEKLLESLIFNQSYDLSLILTKCSLSRTEFIGTHHANPGLRLELHKRHKLTSDMGKLRLQRLAELC